MKIRITYRMERFIECENIEDCKAKFEVCDLNDGKSQYVEIVSVEDTDTFKDLTDEFN